MQDRCLECCVMTWHGVIQFCFSFMARKNVLFVSIRSYNLSIWETWKQWNLCHNKNAYLPLVTVPGGGVSVPPLDRDPLDRGPPPRQRPPYRDCRTETPPWTETPPGQRPSPQTETPADRDPPTETVGQRPTWTEIPLTESPPGKRPPPPDRDSNLP